MMGEMGAAASAVNPGREALKLSNVKVAVFSEASAEDLQAAINDFTAGKAVTGPPAFAANFVTEQIFIGLHYQFDGTNYSALLVYTE
jgi:hypothetical protein